MLLTLSVILSVALSWPGPIQASGPSPDSTIDARTRVRVIQGVLQRLREGYVFPDKATAMEHAIQGRVLKGEYDTIVNPSVLAERLTRDLRSVTHDRHLRVVYDKGGVQDEGPGGEPSPADQSQRMNYARRINWGLTRADRLDGNIGYLQIRTFDFDGSTVDTVLAAAMSFLAHTDALIIDVRDNGGGDPTYVAAVCSYLMRPGTLINKFYWRPQNRWDEFKTRRVSGRSYGISKPVYVLTSDGTFSGAEEFAYDMQTQKRGEIVGDTTGGGAHPGGLRRVTEKFGVWVPSGRAVNPVTGKDWEGTGVIPDVPVASDEALRAAHVRALKRIMAAEQDRDRRVTLQQVIVVAQGPAS